MDRVINIQDSNTNRIFPRIEHIEQANKFGINYTDNHKNLAEHLNNSLENEWMIYIKPYLGGKYPDIFLLLHPDKGMVILKIITWTNNDPQAYSFDQKEFKGKKRNQYAVDSKPIPSPGNDLENIFKELIYNDIPEINKFFDSLETELGNEYYKSKKYCAIRLGYYFPNIDSLDTIDSIFKNFKIKKKYFILVKNDLNGNEDINEKIDNHDKEKKVERLIEKYWNNNLVKKILPELTPSHHKIEHGRTINFTNEQNRIIRSNPGKIEVLKGAAGSGKSLIIGQRAARIAENERSVLVITFNITLINYLKEQVGGAQVSFDWGYIRFIHFHGLCQDIEETYGEKLSPLYFNEDDDSNYKVTWPSAISNYLSDLDSGYHLHRKYDAILIDEAQDYSKEMFEMLNHVKSNENAETLIVFDEKQNLYRNDLEWLSEQVNNISILQRSHRIPEIFIPIVNKFSELYLNDDGQSIIISGVQQSLPFFVNNLIWEEMEKIDFNINNSDRDQNIDNICKDCKMIEVPILDYLKKWKNKTSELNSNLGNNFIDDDTLKLIVRKRPNSNKKLYAIDSLNDDITKEFGDEIRKIIKNDRCPSCERNYIKCENKILDYVKAIREEGTNTTDIAIIVPFHREAATIKNLLNKSSYETVGIENRKEKFEFSRMEDDKIKICTIHSFKGYEISNLIILTEVSDNSFFKTDKVMYTSLTRSTNKLIILNRHKRYEEFGNYLNDYKNSLPIS